MDQIAILEHKYMMLDKQIIDLERKNKDLTERLNKMENFIRVFFDDRNVVIKSLLQKYQPVKEDNEKQKPQKSVTT